MSVTTERYSEQAGAEAIRPLTFEVRRCFQPKGGAA
jgi:hypothetical protein